MYDGWGKNSVTIIDAGATAIANLNPFRYRSYYYDTETNLYFLKTRYYDPEIGRFMTIDGVSYLNPDSINGLNLYAYCGNNPIMATDPNGTDWWNPFTGNWNEVARFIGGMALAALGVGILYGAFKYGLTKFGSGVLAQLGISTLAYGAFMIGSVFDSEIYDDMVAIGGNPFNDDASIITTRNSSGDIRKVSFYKGVPVMRFENNSISSFSFLGIFLNNPDKITDTVVNHEYGHAVQQLILGPVKYGLGIALPSVIYWSLAQHNNKLSNLYYSMPWERTADYFGGVVSDPYNPYTSYSLEVSLAYLLFLLLI